VLPPASLMTVALRVLVPLVWTSTMSTSSGKVWVKPLSVRFTSRMRLPVGKPPNETWEGYGEAMPWVGPAEQLPTNAPWGIRISFVLPKVLVTAVLASAFCAVVGFGGGVGELPHEVPYGRVLREQPVPVHPVVA
jgi:hypothetical protein